MEELTLIDQLSHNYDRIHYAVIESKQTIKHVKPFWVAVNHKYD